MDRGALKVARTAKRYPQTSRSCTRARTLITHHLGTVKVMLGDVGGSPPSPSYSVTRNLRLSNFLNRCFSPQRNEEVKN